MYLFFYHMMIISYPERAISQFACRIFYLVSNCYEIWEINFRTEFQPHLIIHPWDLWAPVKNE